MTTVPCKTKPEATRMLNVPVGSVWRVVIPAPTGKKYTEREVVVLYADRGWCLVIENGPKDLGTTRIRYLDFLAVFEPAPNSKASTLALLMLSMEVKLHEVRGEMAPVADYSIS